MTKKRGVWVRDLSLHVMDIAQNSVAAEATHITISYVFEEDSMTISVLDDGRGMSDETVSKVINPFYTTRTTRNIGLGVPLFKMSAEATGGVFEIHSTLGKGTDLKAVFITTHIDMLPLGDTASTISLLFSSYPDIYFTFIYKNKLNEFSVSTMELHEILEEVPLSEPSIASWLNGYIKGGISEV